MTMVVVMVMVVMVMVVALAVMMVMVVQGKMMMESVGNSNYTGRLALYCKGL